MKPRKAVTACLVVLGACAAPDPQWSEPSPEELADEGPWLEKAGSNVQMDWGPGSRTLLNEYSSLKEEFLALQQRLAVMESERESLEATLEEVRNELKAERSQRAQAEADRDAQRSSVRELEARVLSLNIRTAQLEQENLLLKIASVSRRIEELRAGAPTGAAAPSRSRR